MNVKCIAIGNRIMGDDSIGIKVLEELSLQFKEENIECIFGETDINYALSKIDNGDFLLILDSTYFGKIPGTVTFTPIEESIIQYQHIYSQHQPSLINLLKTYKKSVKGFVIGIEVQEIYFGLELSDMLMKKFLYICEEVSNFIHNTLKGGFNMHDTFLLNKISNSLKELCTENKIKKIEEVTLVVNHNSHINEENLQEHLKLHNTNIIASNLKIKLQREDIEEQTAIIKSIQGETLGT